MKDHELHRDIWARYAKKLGFGDIHVKFDSGSGLCAIIAVHSTKRGPALGGCRLNYYKSFSLAMKDALQLAFGMTLKAAACGLPHGGGKGVILQDATTLAHRTQIFQAFGDFVHELGGRYISSMDLGTTTEDMNVIAQRTPYVIGATQKSGHGDPSPYTAQGIFRTMQAAVAFKLKKHSLAGLTVAIQGAGKSAYYLAKLLHAHKVHLVVTDINPQATKRFADEFGAAVVVEPEQIYSTRCDIFAPCAVGGTINLQTLNLIQAPIIAGAANNQLANKELGALMQKRGILYLPDFIINSGGLIYAATTYNGHKVEAANRLIDNLYERMMALFERSEKTKLPTTEIANQIARENLEEDTHTTETVEVIDLCNE